MDRREYIVYGGVFDGVDMIPDDVFAVRGPGQVAVGFSRVAVGGKGCDIVVLSGLYADVAVADAGYPLLVRGNRVRRERRPASAGIALETGVAGDGVGGFGVEDRACFFDGVYEDVLFDAVFAVIPVPE